MPNKKIVKSKTYLCSLSKVVTVGRKTLFGKVKLRGDVLEDVIAQHAGAVSEYEAV